MSPTGCRYRSLTAAQERVIRAAVSVGTSPRELSPMFGVSVRTIYRTLRRDPLPIQTVVVGDYEAPFVVGDDGPVQMGPWVASCARAWDNDADEYSVAPAYHAQRPGPRLYSESRGVDVPEYRRNA